MAPRNGFVRKKVQSLTLGERIRRIRSERRLSLGEISKATGIQVKYLVALEEGDFSRLPSLVYVHGFLRSYAKYLGENPEKWIAFFERERGIAHTIVSDDTRHSERLWASPKPLVSRALTPWIFVTILSLCLGLGVVWYVSTEVSDFVSDPDLIVDSPQSGETVEDSLVRVSGKTDPRATLYLNDREVLVDEVGVFSEDIEVRNGRNVIILRSVNVFDRAVEREIVIYGSAKPLEESIEEVDLMWKVGVEEDDEAQEGEDVNIQVRVDDEEVREEVLAPGEELSFSPETFAQIISDDEARTYVILSDGRKQMLVEGEEQGDGYVFRVSSERANALDDNNL